MSMHQLTLQIEGLRSEMIRTAEKKGNLNDPQVIALSQELDQLILIVQRMKKQKQTLSHGLPPVTEAADGCW